MPQHRKPYSRKAYSASQSRRRSRQVHNQTIGTHVSRGSVRVSREATFAESVARRARVRRTIVIIFVLIVIAGIAIGAGMLAFRGMVGSELSLKHSNAQEALVAQKQNDPAYTLVSVELGAVAESLQNDGPDVFFLVRTDNANNKMAVIYVPATMQVTVENQSRSLSSVANDGDAALIKAFNTFAKIEVNHFVKIGRGKVEGLVDTLGGIETSINQAIDDPHAGTAYIEAGNQTLNGNMALTYLRATNIKLGVEEQMENQLDFAVLLLKKVFSGGSNFAARMESLSPYIQTDYSLSDLEAINSWLGSHGDDIVEAMTPGYLTESTDVSGSSRGRYIATSADFATLLEDIEEGKDVSKTNTDSVSAAQPSSFTLEVQNGTTIAGAASTTASALTAKGFNVVGSGNAEQQVYDETLVIYKGENGPSRAKAVIDALGAGRAISAGAYYSFDPDVLVIIGADYKPTS